MTNPVHIVVFYNLLKDLSSDVQYEPVYEISSNVVCATSKGPDQPVHTRSLIRAFARRLKIFYEC